MSENNKNNVCEVCGSGNGKCGMCGGVCSVGGYGLIRWILGIIIITWVFSIGMKIGELKGMLDGGGYGKGMHYKSGQMMFSNGGQDVFYSTAVPVGNQ